MAEEHWKLVKRIADTAEKLLAEVIRLHRDVIVLHTRIEPFEDAPHIPDLEFPTKAPRNLVEALDMITNARDRIRSIEYDISAIRGALDGISSDAISREEMKPWLKDR